MFRTKKLKKFDEESIFSKLINLIISVWTEDGVVSASSLGKVDRRFYEAKKREIKRKLIIEKLVLTTAVVSVEMLNDSRSSDERMNRFIGLLCSEIEARGLLNLDDELVQELADLIHEYVTVLGKEPFTNQSVNRVQMHFLYNAFDFSDEEIDEKLIDALHKELLGFQRFISFGAGQILKGE